MDDKTLLPPSPILKENEVVVAVSAPDQAVDVKSPICNSGKNGTPERLSVPKALKYIERYTSPTDQVMSPVTRGILARSRKGSTKLLPPFANNQNSIKIEALRFQDSGPVPI